MKVSYHRISIFDLHWVGLGEGKDNLGFGEDTGTDFLATPNSGDYSWTTEFIMHTDLSKEEVVRRCERKAVVRVRPCKANV